MVAFSAVLGIGQLAMGGVSAMQSMGAAKTNAAYAAQATQARQALEREQMDLQRYNLMLQQDDRRRNQEYTEYIKQQDLLNSRISAAERRRDIDEYEQLKAQALEDRRYAIDRQVFNDQKAAAQRAYQLEQVANNQDITEEERGFARSQLELARRTASKEYTEDLTNYYYEREKQELDREFAETNFRLLGDQRVRERQQEEQLRGRTLSQIESLTATLEGVIGEFDRPTFRATTDQDIATEEARRADIQIGDVDRALKLAGSKTEANLIRRGMDESTAGLVARGDLAERFIPEYAAARERARDEALAYMTGRQGIRQGDVTTQQELQNFRTAQAGLPGATALAGLESLRTLAPPSSAVLPSEIGGVDSAYYRPVSSTGTRWGAPIQPHSAASTGFQNVSTGVGETMNLPPFPQTFGSIRSGINQFTPQNLPSGQQAGANAASIGNNMLSNAQALETAEALRAGQSATTAGEAVQGLFTQAGAVVPKIEDFQIPWNPMEWWPNNKTAVTPPISTHPGGMYVVDPAGG